MWSPEQLARLKHEWGRLQWNFACHPLVRIIALEGDPPRSYQFDYRVRTLAINPGGELEYAATASVQVDLGPDFPYAAPVVRPVGTLFHPNISADTVEIFPAWQSTDTLCDLASRIGALLAFQSYDPYSAWNEAAMEWVAANAGYLPTDAQANFAPEAGGDPLQRITKSGSAALDQFRRELDWASTAIVSGTFALSQVEHFAHRTRLGLGIFSAPGVDASMLQAAQELEAWSRQLPQAAPLLEELGRMKSAAQTVRQVATALEKTVQGLGGQFQAIEHLRPEFPADQPAQIPGHLPAAQVVEGTMTRLRARAAAMQTALAAAKTFSRPANSLPRQEAPFCTPLQSVIHSQTQTQTAALTTAYDQLSRAIADAGPLLERAALEAAALEKILVYRQYADLLAKAQQLIEQTKTWDSTGMQAFFVADPSAASGPFQFEQNLDLGPALLAVRAVGRNSLEIIDVASGVRLARGEGADLSIPRPGSDDPADLITFGATARCDDMAMQLDYLHRQLHGLLPHLEGPAAAAPSWCGKALATLAGEAAFAAFKAAHVNTLETLQTLANDLGALAPFKERLATYFLISRLGESVRRWQEEHLDCQQQIVKANTRTAQIIAKSGKDISNDVPVIPAKFEKDYNQSMELRMRSHARIEQLDRLIASAVKQARVRLESFSLMGMAALPNLKILSPLPDDLTGLIPAMDDAKFAQDIAQLGEMLGVQFAVKSPATRPAQLPP